jgi:hypothetical protein
VWPSYDASECLPAAAPDVTRLTYLGASNRPQDPQDVILIKQNVEAPLNRARPLQQSPASCI